VAPWTRRRAHPREEAAANLLVAAPLAQGHRRRVGGDGWRKSSRAHGVAALQRGRERMGSDERGAHPGADGVDDDGRGGREVAPWSTEAVAGRGEDGVGAAIPALPRRFLRRGGSGRQGGADGMVGWAQGWPERREEATASAARVLARSRERDRKEAREGEKR
jgi:hypothetical protein